MISPDSGRRRQALRTLEFEVGLRAALAAVIPLVVLPGFDRIDLGPYAAFGEGLTVLAGRLVESR